MLKPSQSNYFVSIEREPFKYLTCVESECTLISMLVHVSVHHV